MDIVLWKLGSVEHKVYPTKLAFERFKQMLISGLQNKQEHLDIVWGPDINVTKIEVSKCSVDTVVIDGDGNIHVLASNKDIKE